MVHGDDQRMAEPTRHSTAPLELPLRLRRDPSAPAVAHTSGPLIHPARDECSICARYRSAINAAIGRAQWADVQGDEDGAREALCEEAEYRVGWTEHLKAFADAGPEGTDPLQAPAQ